MDHTAAAGPGGFDRHSRRDTICSSINICQSSQARSCQLYSHLRGLQAEPEPNVSWYAVYTPGRCAEIWSSSRAYRAAILCVVYESFPDYT